MSRTFSSATRVLRALSALKGHALHGLSNTELAQLTGDSPSNITRAMQTLIDEGLAVKLDTGRFAPGIALLQIAQAHAEEMARMQGRINEINQRVLAGARS
ncbi:IclR helix-turn-helix domain protein [compost metagenome]